MPANFTEEQKIEIRKRLLECGYRLSESVGLKKMTIAMIAKQAGIATGTFYHFFESKESFVIALMQEQDNRQRQQLMQLTNENNKLSIDDALKWYRDSFRPENNFLLRLQLEDWMWLKAHLSNGFYFDAQKDIQRTATLLSMIEGIREDIDVGVVVNFFKTIYTIAQNRESFCENALETNVDLIFDAIYRYVKKK